MKITNFLVVALALFLTSTSNLTAEETPQQNAVKKMHSLLEKGDFKAFYNEWCHPHLKRQINAQKFVKFMKTEQGKAIKQLFSTISQSFDNKTGKKDVIGKQQDTADKYEFIISSVKNTPRFKRNGAQWHLELRLDNATWKLADTD